MRPSSQGQRSTAHGTLHASGFRGRYISPNSPSQITRWGTAEEGRLPTAQLCRACTCAMRALAPDKQEWVCSSGAAPWASSSSSRASAGAGTSPQPGGCWQFTWSWRRAGSRGSGSCGSRWQSPSCCSIERGGGGAGRGSRSGDGELTPADHARWGGAAQVCAPPHVVVQNTRRCWRRARAARSTPLRRAASTARLRTRPRACCWPRQTLLTQHRLRSVLLLGTLEGPSVLLHSCTPPEVGSLPHLRLRLVLRLCFSLRCCLPARRTITLPEPVSL